MDTTPVPRHGRTHHRGRLMLGAASAVTAMVAFGTGAAYAYWAYTDSSNGHSAAATADSIPQGATPGAPTASVGLATVSFSFPQVLTSTGDSPLTSYSIQRYPASGGAAVANSARCTSSDGTVSCTETSVGNGSWVYTDTPYIAGSNWTGAESAQSPSVTVDTSVPTASAPTVAGTVTHGTNPLWVNSETVTLTDSPTDVGGTGVDSVAYYYCPTSVSSCTSATPWTPIGSTLTGPNWSVAWTPPLPADGTYDIVAVAKAYNSNTSNPSSSTEVGIDTTSPVVSAPTVAAAVMYGTNPIYLNHETVTLTDGVTDSGSGVNSVAYYYCAGSTTPCNSSNGTQIGSPSTSPGTNFSVSWSPPLPADGPYQVVSVATDNVTNTGVSPSTPIAVDTTPPTVSTPTVNGL